MPFDPELDQIIWKLVDGWCGRRELKPLSIILNAWPHPAGQCLTDDWERLRAALRHTRAMAKERLTSDEMQQVGRAIALTDQAIRP